MTTYILAGGADVRVPDYGGRVGKATRRLTKGPIKFLSCQFAHDAAQSQELYDGWKPWYLKNFGDDTELQLATQDNFLDQVDWADVIYLHGGRTDLMINALGVYNDLEKHFKGKVVIGSSAGANFLSTTYYSPKLDKVGKGSGIVPLHTLVHYGAQNDGEVSLTPKQWDQVVERMKQEIGDEEITYLPEGQFVVFEK